MAGNTAATHPLVVLDGPRICPKGKHKGTRQYLVQWTGLTSKGVQYKPHYLNAEKIGQEDIVDFLLKRDDNQDTHKAGVNNQKTDQMSETRVCQDTAHRRRVIHNNEIKECNSGKHTTPFHICTGCEASRLIECCRPSIRNHIYRDEGYHRVCSSCAEEMMVAEGVPSGATYFYACDCTINWPNEWFCVQCHLDRFAERLLKQPNSGICACGQKVDQDRVRRCSGCDGIYIKSSWSQ